MTGQTLKRMPDRWLSISQKSEEGIFIRSLEAPGNLRTLFYIHGLGESGLGFERVMSHLGLDAFNHLALDLPGYGKSAWPEEPLGLDEHARFLADWIEKRQLHRLILVGHSMGGVIGTLLAEQIKPRIAGFINIEGNISLDDCAYSGKVAKLSKEVWLNGGFEQSLEMLYSDGQDIPALRLYYPSMRMCDPRTYYKNSTDLVVISGEETLAQRLKALDIPTIYMLGDPHGTGEHSRALLSEAGVAWEAQAPAGHWPFFDQREGFVKDVLRFLATL